MAQPKPAGWPLGARIPAISGQVVDALTGKPVANIDVTLRATAGTPSLGDDSGRSTLRYENSRTSAQGQFNFQTSLEAKLAEPFTSLKGYWLSVNRTFLSIESLKDQTPYGEVTTDSTPDDLSWDIARDPLFNRKDARVNNKAYFPMAVQFVRPCKQMWNANCVSFSDTQNVRVPLIPVLDNPEECGKIADQALGEQCRQLNTYQAAFRHVETIAQVRADKEMCGKVEPGLTKTCLESLQLYVANPGAFENRLPLRMEVDPIEKVLILKPIAGMFVIRSGLGHLDPFRETATYGACYSVDTKWQTDAACVTVSLVVSEEDRRTSSRIGAEDGYTKGAERIEVVDGKTVTTLDLPKTYTSVWSSGPRVVRVIFYKAAFMSGLGEERARAATASLQARHELIRQYLLKYPSSH